MRSLLENCMYIQDITFKALGLKKDEDEKKEINERIVVEGMRQAKDLYVKTRKMSPRALERLAALDPTEQKKYIEWMARIWVKEKMRKDDLEKFAAVAQFHEMAEKNIITQKDINQYPTIEALYDEVKKHEGEKSKSEEEREIKGNVDKVFDNDKVLIVLPKDKEASCLYGKNTKWCTAATEYSNYFNSYYYDRYTNLYYILPKGEYQKKYGKIAVAVERGGSKTYYDQTDASHDEAWFKPIGKELGIPGYETVATKKAKKEEPVAEPAAEGA
jgi:hypothetical protein